MDHGDASEGRDVRVVHNVRGVLATAAPRLGYLRAVLMSFLAAIVLGAVGAWLCTVLWFGFYGGHNDLGVNVVTGMFTGILFGLIGPFFATIVAVPTAVVVAWMRNSGKSVKVVRQFAALIAGIGMLLVILVGMGNEMTSGSGAQQESVSLGWVVPVAASLWSAGWAYMLSVWRPPVVVDPDTLPTPPNSV